MKKDKIKRLSTAKGKCRMKNVYEKVLKNDAPKIDISLPVNEKRKSNAKRSMFDIIIIQD